MGVKSISNLDDKNSVTDNHILNRVTTKYKSVLNSLNMLEIDSKDLLEALVTYQYKYEEIMELSTRMKFKDSKRKLCEMVSSTEDLLLVMNIIFTSYFEDRMNKVLQKEQIEFDKVLELAMRSMVSDNEETRNNFAENFMNLVYDTGIFILEKILVDICLSALHTQREVNLKLLSLTSTRHEDFCHLSMFSEKHLFGYKNLFKQEIIDIKSYFLDSLQPLLLLNADSILDEVYSEFHPSVECTIEVEAKKELKKYISSHRLLNKLANDNDFKYVRSNGDHGIFKRFDGSVVVIPQGRDIGKGLSLKIQKRIEKK